MSAVLGMTAEQVTALEAAPSKVPGVTLAQAMTQARKAFSEMMAAVNAELSRVLSPEGASSCSGNCQSCGGSCQH